jgi:toxin ParE1/3/4
MRIEHSNRALQDLRTLAADAQRATALKLPRRLGSGCAILSIRLATSPRVRRASKGRPGVHVIPLIKYPYKIFYRITENAVRILHIRHTSGRPW